MDYFVAVFLVMTWGDHTLNPSSVTRHFLILSTSASRWLLRVEFQGVFGSGCYSLNFTCKFKCLMMQL